MQEERMRILKMVEDGKVSAGDASKLLDALASARAPEEEASGGKKIRIRVTDPKSGKQTVNLSIPIGLARFAAKLIPAKKKDQMLAEGVDIDHIISQITTENVGKVVDIESDDSNVQVTIE